MKLQKSKTEKGFLAEDIAIFYLREQGFCLLERNLRLGRGEVDIVASKNGTVHFIEVKSRFGCKNDESGRLLEEKMTKRKIRSINSVACIYLERIGKEEDPWCVSLMAVDLTSEGELLNLEMLENVVL